MTDVSVVIPSRDRWPYLRESVRAALAQREIRHEVIVVLDGCRDSSELRLGEIEDSRLRVTAFADSGGVSAARNAGIRMAAGDWVAFLDDDDLWSPDKVRRTLAVAHGSDFAYGAAALVDEHRGMIGTIVAPEPQNLLAQLLRRNVMAAGSSNVIMRRTFAASLGGFDETLVHLADWDMWIRAAELGVAAAVQSADVACVKHATNLALRQVSELQREVQIIEARYRELRGRLDVQLDRAGFDRWLGTSQRRAGQRGRAFALLLRSAARERDARNVARAVDTLLSPQRIRRQRPLPAAPDWLEAVPTAR